MLLRNLTKHKTAAALTGQSSIPNVFTDKMKKKKKIVVSKIGKSVYGLGGAVNASGSGGDTCGGGSDGGGASGGDGGGGAGGGA